MSVYVFPDAELAGLWHRLGRAEDLRLAIQALAIANRAAFMLSYAANHEDARTIEAPDFAEVEPRPVPVADWSALTWADNLLYNCVTNGGTDFAPARDANALRRAAVRADAAPGLDAPPTGVQCFTGTVHGVVATYVEVVDGCITRVCVHQSTFECDPAHLVVDDAGNRRVNNAPAVIEHILDQAWPHWEFG